MKILSGALRGRVISFKAGAPLRPTSDKVRKAIFDMLRGELAGKNVLDLFSGTGALGFEALSGGAAGATFVEQSDAQARRIRDSAARLGVQDKSRVLVMDSLAALSKLRKEGEVFDLVFLDPPYGKGLAAGCLEAVGQSGLFHEGAWVVVECRRGEAVGLTKGGVHRKAERDKVYGDTRVLIYRMGPWDLKEK